MKQFIGLAVRAILEDAGFEVAYSGVRIKDDRVFTSGSVYRERSSDSEPEPAQIDDALERMLKALRPDQAARALVVLCRHNPHLLDAVKELSSQRLPAKGKR